MFYTGPSLSLQNKAVLKFKELNMNQLEFAGKNQLLKSKNNIKNKNEENNKNNASKDKFSIIYSDMTNSNENEDNSKSIKSNKSKIKNKILESNFNSSFDLEPNNKENNENKDTFQFSKKKKRSKSIEYYNNLTFKSNGKNGEGQKSQVSQSNILKKSKANSKLNNKKHLKNNNEHKDNEVGYSNNKKKKESVGSVNSVKSKNKNKDIIENKKISLNSKNNNSVKGITENNKKFINNINININNSTQKNNNELEDDAKNDNKTLSKNENIIKNENQNSKNIDDFMKNNKFPIPFSRNNNTNSNHILKPLNLISKSQNDFNSLSLNQINSIFNRNNYNIDLYNISSLSKNHKISNVLSSSKEQSSIIRLFKNAPLQKNIDIDIDSDTGIEYKIVSFDMPKNESLPQKTNQFYALYGKKLHKKQHIKTEEKSPLDEIYKNQYEKKLKKEKLKSLSNSNDAPKKITPAFGRTAYVFYSKKDLEGFRRNYTSSNYLKGGINLNTISSMNNHEYINTKYFAKSHRRYYLDKNNI